MEEIYTLFKTIMPVKVFPGNTTPEEIYNYTHVPLGLPLEDGTTPQTSKINIISWNYDSKKKRITAEKIQLMQNLNPDILIIQECTYYECIVYKKIYKYVSWYGDGKDSIYGLSVLSNKFNPHIICNNIYEQKFRYIIPYEINIDGLNFLLLAVWTKGKLCWQKVDDDIHCLSYIENIFEAIDFYDALLEKYSEIIIIGDFNSFNKMQKKQELHIALEDKLKQYDIFNCTVFPGYTYFKDFLTPAPGFEGLEKQNFETEVTYYHEYNSNNAGTNDYCFLKKSENIYLNRIGIGYPEKWINYSDHFPLWLQFTVRKPNNY